MSRIGVVGVITYSLKEGGMDPRGGLAGRCTAGVGRGGALQELHGEPL